MALPITGGDQKPILKYNAKSAKWKVDDTLLNDITMIVDMANVEVGWMKFQEGSSPEFVMVPAAKLANGMPFPSMPEAKDASGKPLFKRGFRATIKLADRIAGKSPSVREWASNSLATCRGFNALHDAWLATLESGNPELVPVIKTNGVTEMVGQFGSNYAPTLVIAKWVTRPADLQLRIDNEATVPFDDDIPGEPEMRDGNEPESFDDFK